MRIECQDDWREALTYFSDPDTIAQMVRMGMFIKRWDFDNKYVEIGCHDDEVYARHLASISDSSTNASPTEPLAVNTIVS
jgi:hypothetical protein